MGLADADGVLTESYSYDAFGRRRNAQNWSYDNITTGNITDLQRHKDNTLIDNLIYAFYSNGNRLQSVEDASGNTAGYMPNTGQYLYDANGNMSYDPSRKITVSYNQLNLPRFVEFDIDLSPDNRRETTILLTPTPPPASNSAKPSWRGFAIRVHKNQDFNSRVLISYLNLDGKKIFRKLSHNTKNNISL